LLFLAVIFFLPRFFLVVSEKLPHALTAFEYVLLALSVLLVAGSGYVINDVYDQEVDRVNKPQRQTIGRSISEKAALQLFGVLAVLGVGIGVFLAYKVGMPVLGFIHPIGVVTLWLYAMDFKKRPVIGNLLISLLSGLALMLIAVFDLVPMLGAPLPLSDLESLKNIIVIILVYGGFAFFTTWIREIVKDVEDFEGDNRMGYKTLPVVVGIPATKVVVSALLLTMILGIGYYLMISVQEDLLSFIYVLSAVEVPLIFVLVLTWKAQVKADYSRMSNLLKIIMFMGILSIMVFTLAMRLNGNI
jgi:4-hydroxybenzoate polyprenyltransferase